MFGGSRYNPDEPRDWHGRWTSDGSSWRNAPLSDPSRVGRADLLLGHGRFGAWQKGLIREFVLPTPAEAQRFSRLLTAWNAASDLDDETFRDLFIDGLDIAPATLHRLRDAAAGSAQAETMGQMIQASTPLTDAIKAIGVDRWDRMLAGLEDRADAAMPKRPGSGNRTASRDHEDQPIDSERGKPSSLLRLAAFDGALAGALALSPQAAAALAGLGLAEAALPAAMAAALIAAVLMLIKLPSNGEAVSGTLPDGTRYRLTPGPAGYAMDIILPDGRRLPIPTAPDGEVRDRQGRRVGRIVNGQLIIDRAYLASLAQARSRVKLCPDATDDRPNGKKEDAIVYEAYIQQLVGSPIGKGVPLPTPQKDLDDNPLRDPNVMFDACHRDTGTMIEAKGTGYAEQLMKPSRYPKQGILDDWLGQAKRQTSAAEAQGRPVVWFFAEEAAAEAAEALFEENKLNITVIYMPMWGARP